MANIVNGVIRAALEVAMLRVASFLSLLPSLIHQRNQLPL